MAIASIGLQTAIWNNNLKSIFLLVSYPIIIMAMAWAFFALTGYGSTEQALQTEYSPSNAGIAGLKSYWHIIIIAVCIWFIIAWLFHQTMINTSTGAKPMSRKENPKIYNMTENLCISRGIPMVKMQIMNTPILNAFASGLSDKNFTITLTTGIIAALEDDELEAVIGHELSHIRHRDVRLLIISVIFVGMISFLANITYRSMMWGGSHRRQGQDGRMLIIAMIILAIGYSASIMVRFALSRKREFMADAGSVELTKNPDAMIRALQKISGRANLPVSDDIKQMCIENSAGFMGGMFATHPPIKKRIKALIALGGHYNENISLNKNHKSDKWLEELQKLHSEANQRSKRVPFKRHHGPWG